MTGMDRSSFILLYSLDNIQNPRAGELKLGPILVRVGFMGDWRSQKLVHPTRIEWQQRTTRYYWKLFAHTTITIGTGTERGRNFVCDRP
jgi:hypothetical protein